jgi:hypothetical protein
VYEERAVAFLDILGFKDAIVRGDSNLSTQIQIRKALTILTRSGRARHRDTRYAGLSAKYALGFSDNIVLAGDMNWVLTEVIALSQAILSVGFLVRGGIALGNIFYKDRVVFGPALVQAVEIEKTVAGFSRVVVDRAVMPNFRQELSASYSTTLICDSDGETFVDFLSQPSSLASIYEFEYSHVVANLRALITNSLDLFRNEPGKRAKYEWLRSYFNKTMIEKGFEPI